MNRRNFLKLLGAMCVVPGGIIKTLSKPPDWRKCYQNTQVVDLGTLQYDDSGNLWMYCRSNPTPDK